MDLRITRYILSIYKVKESERESAVGRYIVCFRLHQTL
jgi:hypothetical protein